MRITIFITVAMTLLLAACGSQPKQAAAPDVAIGVDTPKPSDEWRRFPRADIVDTKVIEKQLMGKPFMPGGTLGRYKKGDTEYEMFVARMPSVDEATYLLVDWKKVLADAKVVSSFGGYFGRDAGRPTFVFSKGQWIAGVAGLPQNEAETKASLLAAYLN
jgi:hypothetical protein